MRVGDGAESPLDVYFTSIHVSRFSPEPARGSPGFQVLGGSAEGVRIVVERSRDFKLVANRQVLRRQTKRWRSLARSERCNAACRAISQRRHEAGAGRNAKRSRSASATTLSVPEYPSIGAAVATSASKALRSVGGEMPDIWWMAHEPRRSGVQRGDGSPCDRKQSLCPSNFGRSGLSASERGASQQHHERPRSANRP